MGCSDVCVEMNAGLASLISTVDEGQNRLAVLFDGDVTFKKLAKSAAPGVKRSASPRGSAVGAREGATSDSRHGARP